MRVAPRLIQTLRNGEDVIVAGDLNDRRGEPTLRRIRGFDDLWGDLIQTGNVNFFDSTTEDNRWTYQFQGVRGQIDHILVSRSVFEGWRNRERGPGSDQRPGLGPPTVGRDPDTEIAVTPERHPGPSRAG